MGAIQRFFGLEKRANLPKMTTNGSIMQSWTIPNWLTFGQNSSGQTVNRNTSLNLSSFYGSVRNISEDIAKLPFYVYKVDKNGNKTKVPHVATTLLSKQPSSVSIPFTFKQTLIEYALIEKVTLFLNFSNEI